MVDYCGKRRKSDANPDVDATKGGEMNELDLIKVAGKYLSFLEAEGLQVEMFYDFEAVPQAALEAGRDYQLPTFAIERVDHTEAGAFWLFLKEGEGRIGVVAVMLQDLGRERFTEYLRRVARHQYPHQGGEAISKVASSLGKVNGRLGYIGELALRSDRRGKTERLAAFMRLAQVLAVQKWDVDWVYGFIPDRHRRARLDLAHGFTQAVPFAQTWVEPVPAKRSSTEWWVGTPRVEMEEFFQAELGSAEIL